MSEESTETMDDPLFKEYAGALQRIGENIRSAFYAYILIFGALLIWSLNSIVYPAAQQRIGEIGRRQVEILKCLDPAKLANQASAPDNLKKQCGEVWDKSIYARSIKDPPAETTAGTQASIDSIRNIDIDNLKHEMQTQLDRSAEMAHFNVPIVGVASDRNWFWLINAVLGLLFYYVIRDSLANGEYLLRYLYRHAVDNPARMVLLSTTQVITSATRVRRVKADSRNLPAKVVVVATVLSIPLFISGLVLYDWWYFVWPHGDDNSGSSNAFLSEPEFVGGIATILLAVAEARLFFDIFRILLSLSVTSDSIQTRLDPMGYEPRALTRKAAARRLQKLLPAADKASDADVEYPRRASDTD